MRKATLEIRDRKTSKVLYVVDVEFPRQITKTSKAMQARALLDAEQKVFDTLLEFVWKKG